MELFGDLVHAPCSVESFAQDLRLVKASRRAGTRGVGRWRREVGVAVLVMPKLAARTAQTLPAQEKDPAGLQLWTVLEGPFPSTCWSVVYRVTCYQ